MGSKPLEAAAPLLGLKAGGQFLYGRYRGYPVAVSEAGPMEGYLTVWQVLLTPEAVGQASGLVADKDRVKGLGLKPGQLRVDPNARELIYSSQPAFRTKPEDVARILDAMLAIAQPAGAALGDLCEQCRTNHAGDVILLNGMPTQLCAEDLRKLQASFEQHVAAAKAVEVRYGKGIGFGILGMLVGAALWAGIGIATERVFVLVAFAVAGIIAYLLYKGAGRITLPLIGVMAILTLGAIFIGDLLWIAALIVKLGGPFDLGLALEAYLTLIGQDADFARETLISYGIGVFGIVVAGYYMGSAAKRTTPRFEVMR